jgi:probable rRNA maturation factor
MNSVKQSQNIVVQVAKNFKDIDVCFSRLEKLVKGICNRFKLSRATISIALVDNTQIRRINKQFLNRNKTTDCLSFDLSDVNHKSAVRCPVEKIENRKLFELVVNAEEAVKKANLRGHSAEAELALYITHGLLHNLGFDDSTQSRAKKMHQAEDEILKQFGYGLVYSS